MSRAIGPPAAQAARGTVSISYSCGVSGRWNAVPDEARSELVGLAGRR